MLRRLFILLLLEVIVGCYGLNRIHLKRNVEVLNLSALDCALVWKQGLADVIKSG